MATWFDLPVEVKQSILEYVVSTIKIKFTPRHGGTRSSRAKEAKTADDESAAKQTDAVSSLLLVSKRFLNYLEIESALLSDAIISIDGPRCLTHQIGKRFSNDVLVGIRELKITHNLLPPNVNRRPGATALLPADQFLSSRMPSLQKITIHYLEACDFWTHTCHLTFKQAIAVAKGCQIRDLQDPSEALNYNQSQIFTSDNSAALARSYLQCFLRDLLGSMSYCGEKYLPRFLGINANNSTYERALSWVSNFHGCIKDKEDFKVHKSHSHINLELMSSRS